MSSHDAKEDPIVINVARDFSRTPGGRFYTDGPASGQQFREQNLIPALEKSRLVIVQLDGARGYPSSFLEEAFGGLIRQGAVRAEEFFQRLEFSATGAFKVYVDDIRAHVKRESLVARA